MTLKSEYVELFRPYHALTFSTDSYCLRQMPVFFFFFYFDLSLKHKEILMEYHTIGLTLNYSQVWISFPFFFHPEPQKVSYGGGVSYSHLTVLHFVITLTLESFHLFSPSHIFISRSLFSNKKSELTPLTQTERSLRGHCSIHLLRLEVESASSRSLHNP